MYLSKRLYDSQEKINFGKPTEVLVAHTNANCFNFKFSVSPEELMRYNADLTFPHVSDRTKIVLWPETAITGEHWIKGDKVISNEILKIPSEKVFYQNQNIDLITGITLKEKSNKKEAYQSVLSPHAGEGWYKNYNGIINIQSNKDTFDYRVKQVMVPIRESAPYAKYLYKIPFVPKIFRHSHYAFRKEDGKVIRGKSGFKYASLICYETLFGNEFTKYVRNGANFIFMHLNEGFYDSKEIIQFTKNMGVLRAIENRRYVVRSSNYGVTCILNTKGDVLEQIDEHKAAVLKRDLYPSDYLTFYSRYGDFIGKISVATLLLIMLFLQFEVTREMFRANNGGESLLKPL